MQVIDPFGQAAASTSSPRGCRRCEAGVIVENHAGAGSTAAPALVPRCPPTTTCCSPTPAPTPTAPRLGATWYGRSPGLRSVAALTSQPYVLVAGAWSGITTVTGLVGAADARPGEIRFASADRATGTHPAVESSIDPTSGDHEPMKPCCASQSRATWRSGLPSADFCRFISVITSLVRAAEMGAKTLAMSGLRS